MQWKGKQLDTIGELLDAVVEIARDGTPEQAQEFMTAYRAENLHAVENIGYVAGYCGPETAKRIWDWFGCAHPIFGTTVPTADEAFAAGERWAIGHD